MKSTSMYGVALSCGVAGWLCGVLFVNGAGAQDAPHAHQHHSNASSTPRAFEATSARSFSQLMDDAMNVMNDGMSRAPMNSNADHDFASMMIPHHQGAVDMAKAELLYGTNPVLRRLAQEIIVTQGSEIGVMRAELGRR